MTSMVVKASDRTRPNSLGITRKLEFRELSRIVFLNSHQFGV
jgi:hypothetical protein